jgi:hypothetical protein
MANGTLHRLPANGISAMLACDLGTLFAGQSQAVIVTVVVVIGFLLLAVWSHGDSCPSYICSTRSSGSYSRWPELMPHYLPRCGR